MKKSADKPKEDIGPPPMFFKPQNDPSQNSQPSSQTSSTPPTDIFGPPQIKQNKTQKKGPTTMKYASVFN